MRSIENFRTFIYLILFAMLNTKTVEEYFQEFGKFFNSQGNPLKIPSIHVYTRIYAQTIIIILLANRKHGGNASSWNRGRKPGTRLARVHRYEGRRGGGREGRRREKERGKETRGGGGDRFVQAIFCFSLPTALAEYSRAILGPNVN